MSGPLTLRSSASGAEPRRIGRRSRLGAGFALAVLGAGSLVLWIGVPVGGMWLASKLTDSFGLHMPLALALVVPGMLLIAMGLAWVNDLYLRVTGGEIEEIEGLPRRRRGPLEPILAISFALAAVSLVVWFFLLAENPARGVW